MTSTSDNGVSREDPRPSIEAHSDRIGRLISQSGKHEDIPLLQTHDDCSSHFCFTIFLIMLSFSLDLPWTGFILTVLALGFSRVVC